MKNNHNATMHARSVVALITGLLLSANAWAQATLQDISFSSGAGGAVEVILELDQAVQPTVFTTDNPPRIAIDLADTANAFAKRSLAVGSGATRSVTAVEAGGRTRVVIDLFRSAAYDTRVEGNRLIVSVRGGGAIAESAQQAPVPGARVSTSGANQVQNVDFRRGPNGEARIVVTFAEPGASVNLNKRGDQIVAMMSNVNLPAEFDQRLDVMDFATPVEFIDTTRNGNRVQMQVTVRGEYEHLAYQTGNQYVVEVREYVEPEDTRTPEEIALAPPTYSGNKVTFNFQDIPVRALMQLIADVSGLNVVVSDSVSGNVTLRLQNVPWDQALDIVLQAKALDKRQIGNVIWVAPAVEIAAREQAQLAALAEKRELEPLRSTFIQVNYAKAVDLADIIQSATGGGGLNDVGGTGLLSDRGSVTVDERTNVLLLNDTADRLSEIRELVTLLDRPVRQVQIESRIVVATDTFGKELGARFGLSGAHEDNHGNLITTSGSLDGTDRMANLGLINRQINPDGSSVGPVFGAGEPPLGIVMPALGERLNLNLPASATAGSFGVSILTSDYLLDLELSALEQEGRGEVVSSPRLITANQKESFIQQGVEIPFQQASSSGATNVEFKEAVLELRVQPLITPDDRIILDLAVKKDSVGELFPLENGAFIPSVDTREIQTQVLVDNGQTVVLGGIYEQTVRLDKNKVPILGDVPGLGRLFRQKTEQDDKSELLIFVTPTILSESIGAY